MIEIDEPSATAIGGDDAEWRVFRAAQERLTAGAGCDRRAAPVTGVVGRRHRPARSRGAHRPGLRELPRRRARRTVRLAVHRCGPARARDHRRGRRRQDGASRRDRGPHLGDGLGRAGWPRPAAGGGRPQREPGLDRSALRASQMPPPRRGGPDSPGWGRSRMSRRRSTRCRSKVGCLSCGGWPQPSRTHGAHDAYVGMRLPRGRRPSVAPVTQRSSEEEAWRTLPRYQPAGERAPGASHHPARRPAERLVRERRGVPCRVRRGDPIGVHGPERRRQQCGKECRATAFRVPSRAALDWWRSGWIRTASRTAA